MTQTASDRKYEERLAYAMETLTIHEDYAMVPSISSNRVSDMPYRVEIDPVNLYATHCDCYAGSHEQDCLHCLAVDRVLDSHRPSLYERWGITKQTVAAEGDSIEEVIEEAEALLSATPDEIAEADSEMDEPAQRVRYGEWLLTDVYEQLADEKNPLVNAIRDGKFVQVRWSELSESEKRAAYHNAA